MNSLSILVLILLCSCLSNVRAKKVITKDTLDSLYEMRFYEQIFHLESKEFTDIEPLVFWGLDDLRILNLSHNHLTKFQRYTFHGMPNLEILDLSYNRISFLDNEIFSKLISLESLNLRGNRLSYKEPGLSWFTNVGLIELTSLDLSRNHLTFIDEATFNNLRKLEHLNLEYNRIYEIPNGTFGRLDNIESINLQHNNLKRISAHAFNSACILTVKLNENPIFKYLEFETIAREAAGVPAVSKYNHEECVRVTLNSTAENATALVIGPEDAEVFSGKAASEFTTSGAVSSIRVSAAEVLNGAMGFNSWSVILFNLGQMTFLLMNSF